MVESRSKLLSENIELIKGIPNPCMKRAIQPTYDKTSPVWSGANPNCSIAKTKIKNNLKWA